MSTAKKFETLRAESALTGANLFASTGDLDMPMLLGGRRSLARTFGTLER